MREVDTYSTIDFVLPIAPSLNRIDAAPSRLQYFRIL